MTEKRLWSKTKKEHDEENRKIKARIKEIWEFFGEKYD